MNRETHLETDIRFDESGDIVVSRAGDIELASGWDCLQQDLRDRLETLPGDLYHHPDWGCRISGLLGAAATPLNQALALRFLREALEDESRIEPDSIVITPLVFHSEEKRFMIRFASVGGAVQRTLVWGLND